AAASVMRSSPVCVVHHYLRKRRPPVFRCTCEGHDSVTTRSRGGTSVWDDVRMVILNRIYTRTGDDGTTALGDFSRTAKTDPRLVAYADTDEANSAIGVALAHGVREDIAATLTRVQNDLFDVGADLCNPLRTSYEHPPLRVKEEWVAELEADCDRYNEELQKLRSFILPGGTVAAAHLHVARTVVRRAERSAWAALEAYGDQPAPEGA